MGDLTPDSSGPSGSQVIDLSHIETQGFCPYCHNLSLEDHGPAARDAKPWDYYRLSYDKKLWLGYSGGEVRFTGSSEAVQQPYPNLSCQYCSLLSECILRFNPWPRQMNPGQNALCSIILNPKRNAWIRVSTPKGGLVNIELWTAQTQCEPPSPSP